MTERQVTFIDTDENKLIVRLKEARVQLSVVDSEPELAGRELCAFATALFAAYVGAPLSGRLAHSCSAIAAVQAKLVANGQHELAAALDEAMRAVAEVGDAMKAATTAVAPDPAPRERMYKIPGPSKSKRGQRLGEEPRLGWGWARAQADADRAAAS